MDTIQIFIKVPNAKTFVLAVEPNTPIKDVKNLVCDRIGLLFDRFKLMYTGKFLQNEKTLQDYGVKDDCTIQVW